MHVPFGMRLVQVMQAALVGVAVAAMAGCSSVDQRDSTLKTSGAIAPPEIATACPITQSAIESMVVKTTGLAYNGTRFGNVGTYTYLLAEAKATVKGSDPCAPTIVDLTNAADGSGTVKYSFDVVILTPTDPAKGNGTLIYEVVNREGPSRWPRFRTATLWISITPSSRSCRATRRASSEAKARAMPSC